MRVTVELATDIGMCMNSPKIQRDVEKLLQQSGKPTYEGPDLNMIDNEKD